MRKRCGETMGTVVKADVFEHHRVVVDGERVAVVEVHAAAIVRHLDARNQMSMAVWQQPGQAGNGTSQLMSVAELVLMTMNGSGSFSLCVRDSAGLPLRSCNTNHELAPQAEQRGRKACSPRGV
jgi:hypothetical protein